MTTTRIRWAAAPAIALAVLSAACTDPDLPSLPTPTPPALAEMRCTASVAGATVECRSASADGGGASRTIVVGGQRMYVWLRSSGVGYDAATRRFSFDVSVQNLMGEKLGTADGVTPSPTGIRVFFSAPPTATSGTGTIAVLDGATGNPAPTSTFTASNQPFYQYDEVVEGAGGVSAKKRWLFDVPSTVSTFSFSVFVSADLPREDNVLRWTRERGYLSASTVSDVWGADTTHVYAVGSNGVLLYNGHGWTVRDSPLQAFTGVTGTSRQNVWFVGGGRIARYDGSAWSMPYTSSTPLSGIWAASPTSVFAVGNAGTVVRLNGSTWTAEQVAGVTESLAAVSGNGASNVIAVGNSGRIVRFNGTAWSTMASNVSERLNDVWVAPSGAAFAVGDNGSILHYNGTSWSTAATFSPYSLRTVWGSSPTDVYAAGFNTSGGAPLMVHFDGTSWQTVPASSLPDLTGKSVSSGWSDPSGTRMYVAYSRGTILRFDGSQWSESLTSPVSAQALPLEGVWGSGASDVYAVGLGGTLLRSTDGQGWGAVNHGLDLRQDPTNPSSPLRALRSVAGASSGAVYVAGDQGTFLNFDGTAWSVVNHGQNLLPAGNTTPVALNDVAALGSSVFAVGASGTLLQRVGGTWSVRKQLANTSNPGTCSAGACARTFNAVWGSSPSNVYAVGNDGIAYRFDGASWSELSIVLPGETAPAIPLADTLDLYSVWGSSASDIYVGGDRSNLFHFNGTAWSRVDLSGVPNLGSGRWTNIWGSGPGNVIVVGPRGRALRYNGTRWTLSASGALDQLNAVWGTDARNVYMVGEAGTILHGTR